MQFLCLIIQGYAHIHNLFIMENNEKLNTLEVEFCTKETILLRLKVLEEEYKKLLYLKKEILTLDETAKLLSLSKSALYKLTSGKEIPFYVPFGKIIYFRRSELENWIFNDKNKLTPDGFQSKIDEYLITGKKL